MFRKIGLFIVAACVCVSIVGCAGTKEKIEQSDKWVQDQMW